MPHSFSILKILQILLLVFIGTHWTLAQDSLRIYANQGYPFVKAYKDSTNLWNYQLGDYYLWGDVLNDSLLKTPNSTLTYISGIQIGEPFKQNDFENFVDRLERTNWFESKCPIRLLKKANRQQLLIGSCLREINQHSIEGSMGYENSENSEGLQGYLQLELNNLKGSGHSLRFTGQWLDPLQEMDLNYQYIHLFSWPIDLNFTASHYQDSLQQEQSAGLNVAHSRFEYWRPFVGVQFSLYNPVDSTALYWNTYRTGAEWGFFKFLPTQLNLKGKAQISLHKLEQWVTQYSFKNEIKIPLSKLQLRQEYTWAMTWPYQFESPSLINKLGGHQNLRGYSLNTFATAWYHLSNAEIRWAVNPYLMPGLFYDAAYFESLSYDKEFRNSYGITLNFQSPNRKWSANLSYAVNPERSFEEGWIHFLLRHHF